MTAPPLTHHEIVGFVEPFTRAGRHVDLAASDRTARQLVFKPVMHDVAVGQGAWREVLKLDLRDAARPVLERVLHHPAGLDARVESAGPDAGVLLAQVLAVPPQHHFDAGDGYLIARSYAIDAIDAIAGAAPLADAPLADPPLRLMHGVVQVAGLRLDLRLKLPHLRTVAGDLDLTPAPLDALDLPEDLLAVQGWDWARLVRTREGWTSKLRLRGNILRRSRTAEAALVQVARHLVRVFAAAPERFHERHVGARWGVVLRRAIPTLTIVFMVVAAALLPRFTPPDRAGVWMALHYLPIALLALAFSVQELACFEIPPLPRRLKVGRWLAPEARLAQAER